MNPAPRIQLAAVEHTAADRLIHTGPLILHSVAVCGDGAAGYANLYNGNNAQGELKVRISVGSGLSQQFTYNAPVLFQDGLYVDVDATTTHVSVTYSPLEVQKVPPEA